MNTAKDNGSVYDPGRPTPKGYWLSEFLWICAGADRQVLRRCPTDHAKFAGIGGTILFTALMAWMSGGYALYSVFHNGFVAALFGLFWGLLIFNLDRFIVNTMYSDGKTTISLMELASGAPRIVMAIFLGIVISTPLELKIFEDEIAIQVEEMKKEREAQYVAETNNEVCALEAKIDSITFVNEDIRNKPTVISEVEVHTGNAAIDAIVDKIRDKKSSINDEEAVLRSLKGDCSSLSNQIKQQRKLIEDLSPHDVAAVANVQNEIDRLNRMLASKRRERASHQTVYNNLTSEMRQLQVELANQNKSVREALKKGTDDKFAQIEVNNREIDKIKQERDSLKEVARLSRSVFKEKLDKEFNGFQAKMLAFSKMKDKSSTTRIASIFIMLLFIIIETAPTFFKMMIEDGPYESILNSEKERVDIQCHHTISDLKDEVNTSMKISTQSNKLRILTEAQINADALDQLARAQSEIIQTAIESWKTEQMAKATADPGAFLNVSSSAPITISNSVLSNSDEQNGASSSQSNNA